MTIVVGYFATKEGRAALDRAVAEAKLRTQPLVVINSDRGGSGFTGEQAAEQEQALQGVKDQMADAGIEVDVRGLVRGKEPAEDLIAVAEETSAELIVIGLRRRTPVGKLILGSNAQRVLLDAPCPVLAVKAES